MPSVPIADIIIGERHRKDMGDIVGLAQNIDELGLLQPIVVRSDNVLIGGERRIKAALELGWTDILAIIVDLQSILRGELALDFQRQKFAVSECVAIGLDLEPMEKAAAEERMLAGIPSSNLDEGRTDTRVAKLVGMGKTTYRKAKEIVEAAKAEPEKFGKLVEEMDKNGRVAGVYKKLKIARQVAKIDAEPEPLPEGPFRVIVIDPPWSYRNRPNDPSHRAANPYPSKTLKEIKGIPVESRAHDDCILWLWTTNAHLREAFEVVDAWGFTYKTLLTWIKHKMGTGHWLRGKTEHCLMCVRGKPTVILTNQTTAIEGKAREHSRKPEEFYAMVEAFCPGSKLDWFGRTQREGWVVYGDESNLFF